MKSLFACLLLLTCAVAHADTTALADTGCTNFICFNPAPGVNYVGTDSTYSTAIAMVDGVLYTGPTTSLSADPATGYTTITADLRAADGRVIALVATFRRWVTVTNSGRAHYRITHLELLSGSIQ